MKFKPLRFTPYAYCKLLFMRDIGKTEVGAMGISSEKDSMLVEDIILVKQECSTASTDFDTDGIADFFDDQVNAGLKPHQFGRIWIHTHPGNSPSPSYKDEETFKDSFSGPDWAVMFIIAMDGSDYARIRFNVGPGCQAEIPIEIEHFCAFPGVNSATLADWKAEYDLCVEEGKWNYSYSNSNNYGYNPSDYDHNGHTTGSNHVGNRSQAKTETRPRFSNKKVWWDVKLDDGTEIKVQAESNDQAILEAEKIRDARKLTQQLDHMKDPAVSKDQEVILKLPVFDEDDELLFELPEGCDEWTPEQWADYDEKCDEELLRQERLAAETEAMDDEEWEDYVAEHYGHKAVSGFNQQRENSYYNSGDDYYQGGPNHGVGNLH
jgi:proteasome lid subunit RPN8/RPN11